MDSSPSVLFKQGIKSDKPHTNHCVVHTGAHRFTLAKTDLSPTL